MAPAALSPSLGGGVSLNLGSSFRGQAIPESVVAQGPIDEHLAGSDRHGEVEHCDDFQLPAVEGSGVVWIIEHESTPLPWQRLGSHVIDPVIITVRRLFIRHRPYERQEIPRRGPCFYQ
jgi:hypothetical protein